MDLTQSHWWGLFDSVVFNLGTRSRGVVNIEIPFLWNWQVWNFVFSEVPRSYCTLDKNYHLLANFLANACEILDAI